MTMRKLEKALLIQQEIKTNPSLSKKFNIWAFIFSSFWYFKKDLTVKFIAYAVLPFIIFVILFNTLPLWLALAIPYLISHTIAGFRGNSDYKKRIDSFIAKNQNKKRAEIDKQVKYFAISPLRLVVFSVLTFGLYQIYWAYKNWNATIEAQEEKINPNLRSLVFYIIFIYPLFIKIKKDIQKVMKVSPIINITGAIYLILFIIQIIVPSFYEKEIIVLFANKPIIKLLFIISLLVIEALLFVPIQRAINTYNLAIDSKNTLQHKLLRGEVIVLIIGIFANYINPFLPENMQIRLPRQQSTTSQEQNIGEVVGIAYRHIKGYDMVCTEYGYAMQKYPNTFRKELAPQILDVNKSLQKENLSFEKVLNQMGQSEELVKITKESIVKELEESREIFTTAIISQEKNIPMKEVVIDQQNLIDLPVVCKIIDDMSDKVINSSGIRDKINKLLYQ